MTNTKRRKPSKGDLYNESKLLLNFHLNNGTIPTLIIEIGQRGCLTGFEKTNMQSFGNRFANNTILSPQDKLNFREFCVGFIEKIDKLKHDNKFWLKEIKNRKSDPYVNETLTNSKNNLESGNDND